MNEQFNPAHYADKLRHKGNIKFRAFVINIILIAAVWMISMTPFIENMMANMCGFNAAQTEVYIVSMLGIWKIAGVVMFLVPALAMWWESKCCSKK